MPCALAKALLPHSQALGCDGRDRACNGATGGVHARVALLQQSTVQRMLGLTRTDSMQIRQPH